MASTASVRFNVTTHVLKCQHIRELPQALLSEQAEPVFEVKHFTPITSRKPQQGDVTIIASAALGYPKECYEPFLEDVVAACASLGCYIRGIFMADPYFQGASALLNKDIMGNQPCWLDHSRDLLVMVNHFRSEIQHPIIGFGHSMGGTQLTYLSLLHPALFTSLILLEPAIYDNMSRTGSMTSLRQIAKKRDTWPSLESARETLASISLMKRWDKRIIDLYIQYGFYQPSKSSPTVSLAVSRDAELAIFTRPNFSGVGVEANGGFSSMSLGDRRHHPDVDPSARHLMPYYVPATRLLSRMLPNVRPRVTFLDCAKGQAADYNRFCEARYSVCGTGVGGSGGAAVGAVSRVVVPGSHFASFELQARGELAEIVASRIMADHAAWKKAYDEEHSRAWWSQTDEQRKKYDPAAAEALQNWNGTDYIDDAELNLLRQLKEDAARRRAAVAKTMPVTPPRAGAAKL